MDISLFLITVKILQKYWNITQSVFDIIVYLGTVAIENMDLKAHLFLYHWFIIPWILFY